MLEHLGFHVMYLTVQESSGAVCMFCMCAFMDLCFSQMIQAIQVLRFHLLELEKVSPTNQHLLRLQRAANPGLILSMVPSSLCLISTLPILFAYCGSLVVKASPRQARLCILFPGSRALR